MPVVKICVLFVTIFIGCLLRSSTALACRYNVRETGCVYLGAEPYYLWYYVDSNTAADEISMIKQAADDVLADSSIRPEVVNTETQKNHPAMKHLAALDASARLRLLLVSPRDMTMTVTIPAAGGGFKSRLRTALARLVRSPVREEILYKAAKNYAVVLLIEGTDSEQNSMASKNISEAIENIKRQMRFMPKEVANPPVMMTLSRQDLLAEKTLLWSLGLDEATIEKPCAAVLYGRARWIGPLLKGDEITEDMVYNILSVVGADCECGLDRKLIRGTILPVKWNDEIIDMTANDLGFDPENPMVKIEVSQILKVNSSMYPAVPAGYTIEQRDAELRKTIPDLPIPFVEDTVGAGPVLAEPSTFPAGPFYIIAALSILVIALGLFVLIRAVRKNQ